MIACPLCGAKTRVTETRVTATSARRRRACCAPACAGKVTTVEVIVPDGRASSLGKGFVMISAIQLKKLREILDGIDGVEL